MSDAHGVARDQLRAFIERIERLEEEKKTIADDIKDVYGEAKSMGFDTKILRKVISIRKQDADERAEQEAILDTYLGALGMIQTDMFDEPKASSGLDPRLAHTIVTGLQTETGRAALVAAVDILIEREEAEERRSDGGLDIVTKHTEIASASHGEAEDHSDQRETGREAAVTGVGANAGGENVESGAERAGLLGGPVFDIPEPSGPEAERATHSPEEATEFRANAGEGAISMMPAAPDDPVSRTDEASERQHTSTVEIADDCRQGGKEDAAAAGHPAPSFITKAYRRRPHCLNRDGCASYTEEHCTRCKAAMLETEMA